MPSQDPLLTDMRHAPGWYAMLPPPAPANRLRGQQVADWVVVGAGVAGLAAARRLAELAPAARIVLTRANATSGTNTTAKIGEARTSAAQRAATKVTKNKERRLNCNLPRFQPRRI